MLLSRSWHHIPSSPSFFSVAAILPPPAIAVASIPSPLLCTPSWPYRRWGKEGAERDSSGGGRKVGRGGAGTRNGDMAARGASAGSRETNNHPGRDSPIAGRKRRREYAYSKCCHAVLGCFNISWKRQFIRPKEEGGEAGLKSIMRTGSGPLFSPSRTKRKKGIWEEKRRMEWIWRKCIWREYVSEKREPKTMRRKGRGGSKWKKRVSLVECVCVCLFVRGAERG